MKHYSYVTTGGVTNTRTQQSDGTLEDLAKIKPVLVDVSYAEYQDLDKRSKTTIKKKLPYFVGGVIEGKRHDDNVKQRTFLTLDIEQGDHDDPPPSPAYVSAALRRLGGSGYVYTSLSHTEEAPRYRVVLPLGVPIDGGLDAATDVLQASTQEAARKLGVEEWTQPESWVLSQAMYLPARLKGGPFYSKLVTGKAWRALALPRSGSREPGDKVPADIPEGRPDPLLDAIKAAGLYLGANLKHKGMHFIRCPFHEQHEAENDTQTVYYEAHHDGNPRPAVKCFDTAPDEDGRSHLSYTTLVRALKDEGHLTQEQQEQAGVLDDYDTFDARASVGPLLGSAPPPRDWAIERFAPTGKVTVLAGPGGVSKSMLLLHVCIYASLGLTYGEFDVGEPLRSLYVSYEDDRAELHKRIHTLAEDLRGQDSGTFELLYDVSGGLANNLRLFAADDEAASWLLLTKPDKWEPPQRSERVDWLVGYLKAKRIRLLVLDPAVYTHQLEENNIADMATYMQTLTYVAKQAQCAVVVLHHMNKVSGWAQLADINQGSLRGASSFADNARSVAVMVSLPAKDAAAYGVSEEEAKRYAVFKHVKHNYSAPLPDMVFERKGALLVHRPELVKLGGSAMAEAREAAKVAEDQRRAEAWVPKVLEVLADHDGPISTNQIAMALNTRKNRLKDTLEHMEAQEWVEVEAGPNRSQLHVLTRLGRGYLKTFTSGHKSGAKRL